MSDRTSQTPSDCVTRDEIDSGKQYGLASTERERLEALEDLTPGGGEPRNVCRYLGLSVGTACVCQAPSNPIPSEITTVCTGSWWMVEH